MADFDRQNLIDKTREAIKQFRRQPEGYDWDALDARLETCKACEKLGFDGCQNCGIPCGNRTGSWKKKLIDGTCRLFTSTGAEPTAPQPQAKVNEMLIYDFVVTYKVPGSTGEKRGHVVACDAMAAGAALQAAIPEATVLTVPQAAPVLAIAKNIRPEDVDVPASPAKLPPAIKSESPKQPAAAGVS